MSRLCLNSFWRSSSVWRDQQLRWTEENPRRETCRVQWNQCCYESCSLQTSSGAHLQVLTPLIELLTRKIPMLRIMRILDLPCGNAMLVGVGGSGKQSLARLASFICGYSVFQISVTSTYGIADFKENLLALYTKTGTKSLPITFLMTDNQIVNERFLVFINDLLSTGYIADLCTPVCTSNVLSIRYICLAVAGRQRELLQRCQKWGKGCRRHGHSWESLGLLHSKSPQISSRCPLLQSRKIRSLMDFDYFMLVAKSGGRPIQSQSQAVPSSCELHSVRLVPWLAAWGPSLCRWEVSHWYSWYWWTSTRENRVAYVFCPSGSHRRE